MLIYIFPLNVKNLLNPTCMLHVSWILEKLQVLFRTKLDVQRSVLQFVITTWVLDYEFQCLKMVEDRHALLDFIIWSCMRTICHSKPNETHQNKNAYVYVKFCCLYIYIISYIRREQWCSWLRHCATNRKVAGSIPDGIVGIFH